jgi:hypothetical protein
VQVHIADVGVTLPNLDPDVREQAGGHEDLLGGGLTRDYAPPVRLGNKLNCRTLASGGEVAVSVVSGRGKRSDEEGTLVFPGHEPRVIGKELRMPELMIDFITSLDGYGAAEGWPGWWGLEGPEYLAWLRDQPEASYTVLMGANTYRLMSALATGGEPGTDALAGRRSSSRPPWRSRFRGRTLSLSTGTLSRPSAR